MTSRAECSKISVSVSDSGNSLIAHQFLLKVAQNSEPAIRKIIDWLTVARKHRINPPRLPRRQCYHVGVFWCGSKLSNIPREITVCEIFISKIPSKSYLNRFGFRQQDYIRNHYYAYLMLMESSYEWALCLCHSVFNLGRPLVGFQDPSSFANEWMERTGVSHELKRLASLAKAIREIRHGIITPTMIREVNLLTEPFLKSCLNLAQAEGSTFDKKGALSDTMSPAEISSLVGYVARKRSDLTKTIDKLLVNLLPVYEKWTRVFSSVKY